MRRIAASIVALAASLIGVDSNADDLDTDDGVECVEYTAQQDSPNASRLLKAASRVLERPVEGAWVAREHRSPEIVVMLTEPESNVATIEVICPAGTDRVSLALPDLLRRALDTAGNHGALKVTIIPEDLSANDLRRLAELSGWHFWRERDVNGTLLVEVLRDLYRRDDGRDRNV